MEDAELARVPERVKFAVAAGAALFYVPTAELRSRVVFSPKLPLTWL